MVLVPQSYFFPQECRINNALNVQLVTKWRGVLEVLSVNLTQLC